MDVTVMVAAGKLLVIVMVLVMVEPGSVEICVTVGPGTVVTTGGSWIVLVIVVPGRVLTTVEVL